MERLGPQVHPHEVMTAVRMAVSIVAILPHGKGDA